MPNPHDRKNIHAEHRARVRRRFLEHGLDSMEPHEVLELLLFFSIPRIDVNPLAHEIMNAFNGSFINVMNADYNRLLEVNGVGAQTAALIRLVSELSRYTGAAKCEGTVLANRRQIIDFLRPRFSNLDHEELYMLCLNGKNRVLSVLRVSSGNSVSTSADIRVVAR
ncbi:MAG: hypothetical protein FWH06_08275, partial [Oscillospiraceae bacterium]|nr:hypothetical protein [Oscillospiraceae bacterium]